MTSTTLGSTQVVDGASESVRPLPALPWRRRRPRWSRPRQRRRRRCRTGRSSGAARCRPARAKATPSTASSSGIDVLRLRCRGSCGVTSLIFPAQRSGHSGHDQARCPWSNRFSRRFRRRGGPDGRSSKASVSVPQGLARRGLVATRRHYLATQRYKLRPLSLGAAARRALSADAAGVLAGLRQRGQVGQRGGVSGRPLRRVPDGVDGGPLRVERRQGRLDRRLGLGRGLGPFAAASAASMSCWYAVASNAQVMTSLSAAARCSESSDSVTW